jgi:imidazolonepropionase-like amidohydrolase/ABC-type multidrug transport system permease subunit
MSAHIYRLEAFYELLRTLRMPAFAIPTLVFPVAFYSVFALLVPGNWGDMQKALYLFATYSVFGMMGPALFGFGVGLAMEREQGWLALKQVSPMPIGAYFFAKIVMSLIFTLIVFMLLSALAIGVAKVDISLSQWLTILALVLLGAAPFCALGLWIGSVVRGQAAVAIVNLVYLPMSVLSGLWIPLFVFPAFMQKLAVVWPSWHLANMVLGVCGQSADVAYGWHALALFLFTVLFLALAARAFAPPGSAQRMRLLIAALIAAVSVGAVCTQVHPAQKSASKNASPGVTAPALTSNETNQHWLFDNVRVFDGEKSWPQADVLVRDGLIVQIGESIAPAGATVIDGKGKTLLPGLIDSHTHVYFTARADALRFGVTSMLDMFSDIKSHGDFKAQRASTARTDKADLFTSGMLATVKGGHGTQFGVNVDTLETIATQPDALAQWVAARKAEGSDYIKIAVEDLSAFSTERRMPTLDQNATRVLISAAHQQDLLALAHVSSLAPARHLLDDGIDGLVHVFQDALADAAWLQQAKTQGMFVIPTLAVAKSFTGDAGYAKSMQALQQRFAKSLSSEQQRSLTQSARGFSHESNFSNAAANVALLHKAGVTLLAGSDAPNSGTAHGVSLHQELQLLVDAGLSPLEALIAATSAPADAFQLRDRGRIAAGLRADLLLVEGDPLNTIADTLNRVAVYKNGYSVALELNASATVAPELASDTYELSFAEQDERSWRATSDEMLGGSSIANIEQVQLDTQNVLRVKATATRGRAPAVWAGAIHMFSARMDAVNAKATPWLKLRARIVSTTAASNPASKLQLMLFSGPSDYPSYAPLSVGAEWTDLQIDLSQTPQMDLTQLRAIGFVLNAPGELEFELANVRLLAKP